MSLLFGLCLTLTPASAQSLDLPALSPRAEVMQTVGVTEIRVNYASPGKKGREIWNDLVPFDKLWRTGANQATTLETSGPIQVGGTTVPAGTYSVFTIPGEASWTVIFNSNPESMASSYDESLDVARLDVAPKAGEARERLTFLFTDTTDAATRLDLEWDGVRVEIPISTDTATLVADSVESFQSDTASRLIAAARHYARAEDYDRALELMDTSIGIKKSWFNVWVKADILKQSGSSRQAWRLAKEAQALGESSDNFFWEDRVKKAVAEWRKG